MNIRTNPHWYSWAAVIVHQLSCLLLSRLFFIYPKIPSQTIKKVVRKFLELLSVFGEIVELFHIGDSGSLPYIP